MADGRGRSHRRRRGRRGRRPRICARRVRPIRRTRPGGATPRGIAGVPSPPSDPTRASPRRELGEEVEERALIGSRAGVDPRGRERAKALVQLRYGRRRHRGRRRRAPAPGARARPPVRTSPRPRCLPRCHQPTSRRRRRSMMIPRAPTARGAARADAIYFGQHNEGHSHASPHRLPSSSFSLSARAGRVRGEDVVRARSVQHAGGRGVDPRRGVSRGRRARVASRRGTGSRGSDPCHCRSSPGTSATSPARRARAFAWFSASPNPARNPPRWCSSSRRRATATR